MRAWLGGFVALVLWAGQAFAADGVMSIERFMELKPEWDKFVGEPLRLEGRYSSFGRDILRFVKCPLTFRLPNDRVRPTGESRVVEVSGHLRKREGGLYFAVEQLKDRPNDLDAVQVRQKQMRFAKPDDWYALGEWARGRAGFYEDEELAAEATAAYDRGLQLELHDLKERTPAALFALARKADELQVSQALRWELLHEAYQRQWQQLQSQSSPSVDALQNLLVGLSRDLPEGDQPLDTPQPKLRVRYLHEPLATYHDADAETRRKLHRIFYGDVELSRIRQDAAPDGSNGDEIARRIDKRLPELSAVAESYRAKHLQYRIAHVATRTQDEAQKLAAELRQHNQPSEAQDVLRKWIESRAKVLRGDGGPGYLQLAEYYQSLLKDDRAAAATLIAGYEQFPQFEDIPNRLKRLGYQLHNGRWLNPEQTKTLPDDPVQQALRRGEIIPGMTAAQVRSALGTPTAIATVLSAAPVTEIWTYGERGTSRLTVRFQRQPRDKDAKVVEVGRVE